MPPVGFSHGIRPSQVSRSRPFLKAFPSPTATTGSVAVCVPHVRHLSQPQASLALLVLCYQLVVSYLDPLLQLFPFGHRLRERGAHLVGQAVVSVLENLRPPRRIAVLALWDPDASLQQEVAPD